MRKPTQKQLNNLIPMQKRTKAEQREIATKGGYASGIARNKTKNFREIVLQVATTQIQDIDLKQQLLELELDTDIRNYALLKLCNQAFYKDNQQALNKLLDIFLLAESENVAQQDNGLLQEFIDVIDRQRTTA